TRGRVLGVDNSPEFIAYASAQYPSAKFPSLSFAEMSAERLTCVYQFDVIFSNAALHWVRDHRAFLQGVSWLLSPAGRLVISCAGAGIASDIIATLNVLTASPRWKRCFEDFTFPYAFYAPAEYAIWLREAGLQPTRCELVDKDMTHEGADGLAGWFRTTWMPY